MKRVTLVAVVIVLLSAYPVAAEFIVDAGNWDLKPNMPGQEIFVSITGTGNVTNAMVVEEIIGASPLPIFTGGSIINGTIFALNNTGAPSYDFSSPQVAYLAVATESGVVSVAGTMPLAKLVVSTVGVSSGDFAIKLLGTSWGLDTTIGTDSLAPVTYNPGSIHIVPEPSSVVLLVFVLAGIALAVLRHK